MRLAALALSIGLPATPALPADKTDIVVLVNGDRITGEVKELLYGQLTYKTDDMGTIYIEWDKIVSLKTTQVLQVELADGRRFFGQAPEAASKSAALRLLSRTGGGVRVPVELAMSDVVRVATTVEGEAFYKRLDGSVSLGYSFTQANNVAVASVSADVGSRNRKRRWSVALDGQVNSQTSAPSSERASLVSTLERFMPNRYYREGTLEFSRNDELGLDLRTLIGGTYGRYIVQRQGREWRAGAGLAASAETGSDGIERQSLEAELTTTFRLFRLDSPKTNVTAGLNVLPSLSNWGRVRAETSIKARHELVHDLFFELSFNDSYDNTPAEGSKTNDWDVSTSLGYSF
jgi:hypothetical protein